MHTAGINLLTRSLTRRYIMAFVVLFAVISATEVVNQNALEATINDAHTINLAGRQRMLSQRLLAAGLEMPTASGERINHLRARITSDIDDWRDVHLGFLDGSAKYQLKPVNSPAIRNQLIQLGEYQASMISVLQKIRREQPTAQEMNTLITQSNLFVELMDQVVFDLDSEATARTQALQLIGLVLYAVLVFVLVFIAVTIFRPTLQLVSRSLDDLQTSNQENEANNEKLTALNAQLEESLMQVLTGRFSICAYCKSIKQEDDSWIRIDTFLSNYSEVRFSHGLCPDCYNEELARLNTDQDEDS